MEERDRQRSVRRGNPRFDPEPAECNGYDDPEQFYCRIRTGCGGGDRHCTEDISGADADFHGSQSGRDAACGILLFRKEL